MAAYFLCLTAGGGVPLFYRTKGDLKPLPFPVIGSLNGVHMFANTHNIDLLATTTPDAKIIWKNYHNSLTLIIVTQDDNASDGHMTHLLDNIFQSMVLVYGLEDLINIKNVERFKREIKVCYKMVDNLLDKENNGTFAHITNTVDIIISPDNSLLQTYLDAFTEAASSPYGCLMVHGKIAVASAKWWDFSSLELVLISLLINSAPRCSSRDIPVFLPITSPKVPHRLLTYQLIPGVEVSIICGPTPTLSELEREVDRFWRSSIDVLRAISRLSPRNFPTGVTIDPNILGFILINTDTHRCLCTVKPIDEEKNAARNTKVQSISETERRRVLQAFYKTVVGNLYPAPERPETEAEKDVIQQQENIEFHSKVKHKVTDTYICCETHKCYAMQSGQYQFFVLYNTLAPTYAMRSITNKTLTTLVNEKSMQL